YGLNSEALRKLKEQGVDVVVTVDCGINSVDEAEVARSIGLELIITDHHELAERLPDAASLVHPRLPGSTYPFRELCGAGVGFKLAWELARKISGSTKTEERFRNFLLSATTLAAIGTICDIVPLLDENRVLAHHGIRALSETTSPGLRQL